MDAKVVRILTGEVIIGEVTVDHEKLHIKNPRNLMMNQTNQGLQIGLTPVGIPGVAEESKDISFYHAQVIWSIEGSAQIQQQYMKEVTGIITTNQMPAGNSKFSLVR
jgi:hypothetical protein